MNDQDEIIEQATETPITLGCPSLGLKKLPSGADGVAPEADDIQKRREIEHFSLCNGLFPIHTVRTPGGTMAAVEIDGRKFSYACVDTSGPDDHACTIRVYDGVKQVMFISMPYGKTLADPVALGAMKAYIKRISGSGRFHGHGGFLRRAVMRLQQQEGK